MTKIKILLIGMYFAIFFGSGFLFGFHKGRMRYSRLESDFQGDSIGYEKRPFFSTMSNLTTFYWLNGKKVLHGPSVVIEPDVNTETINFYTDGVLSGVKSRSFIIHPK